MCQTGIRLEKHSANEEESKDSVSSICMQRYSDPRSEEVYRLYKLDRSENFNLMNLNSNSK